jgi:hypothetical protein
MAPVAGDRWDAHADVQIINPPALMERNRIVPLAGLARTDREVPLGRGNSARC